MSAAKRRDKSMDQAIPGTPLSEIPVGCCVLLEGRDRWMLVSMRIGGAGDPHCRMLEGIPTSDSWLDGASEPFQMDGRSRIVEACWPRRRLDSSSVGDGVDPVSLTVEGAVDPALRAQGGHR